METNLDLEGRISVLLIDGSVRISEEGYPLIRRLRAEDVAKRHVLEALCLADVVVIGAAGGS
jgi:hypothetical protein